MENASKALLIAASVLIAILLIAMGVRVFTSTSGTTDATESTMKSTEVAMFNNKFLPYSGQQSGAQVKSLINLIISNNATSSKKVKFNNEDSASNLSNKLSSVINQKYTVSITIDPNTGLVTSISTNPSF